MPLIERRDGQAARRVDRVGVGGEFGERGADTLELRRSGC